MSSTSHTELKQQILEHDKQSMHHADEANRLRLELAERLRVHANGDILMVKRYMWGDNGDRVAVIGAYIPEGRMEVKYLVMPVKANGESHKGRSDYSVGVERIISVVSAKATQQS